MRIRILLSLLLLCGLFPFMGMSQKVVRNLNSEGNKLFKNGEYSKAEIEYRKGLELNKESTMLNYNLANTLYRTERMEEAVNLYNQMLANPSLSKESRAAGAHNLGNVHMKAKKYQEAIEAYKESLRNNPADEETRYNLALAQKLLQQEKNQGGGGQNDQNKDQKDEQKDDKQQQDQQNKDNDKQDKTQEKPQDKEEKMSKDNAQKILDAFLKDEKNTQKKIEKAKQEQSGNNSNQKNW